MKNRIFLPSQIIVILILLLVSHSRSTVAQSSVRDASNASFGLFENEDPLEIVLQYDLTTYLRRKPKEEYIKG